MNNKIIGDVNIKRFVSEYPHTIFVGVIVVLALLRMFVFNTGFTVMTMEESSVLSLFLFLLCSAMIDGQSKQQKEIDELKSRVKELEQDEQNH